MEHRVQAEVVEQAELLEPMVRLVVVVQAEVVEHQVLLVQAA
jgi:hypothetical protein